MNLIISNIVIEFFINGGPIMWPILVCLIAATIVALERSLWWLSHTRRSQSDRLNDAFSAISNGRFGEAVTLTDVKEDPFLATVHDGLIHAHSSLLGAMQLKASDVIENAEKRLWVLSTFITLAPLLGLLGTVIGIMHSFNFVGGEELATTKVSGGIAEALIATACGLGIAIICLIPFNYFNRCLGHLRSRLEHTINHVELLAQSAIHHGHNLEEFARKRACDISENGSSCELSMLHEQAPTNI